MTKKPIATYIWPCVVVLLSALFWSVWMFNLEYLRARGGIPILVVLQTACILGVVLAARRLTSWRRFLFLVLAGQVASIACDWTMALLLEPERSALAIDRVASSLISARSFLILFGPGILLGGLQALLIDFAWRYGPPRKPVSGLDTTMMSP